MNQDDINAVIHHHKISENDEASENNNQNSDINVLKMRDNDQDWISNEKKFVIII